MDKETFDKYSKIIKSYDNITNVNNKSFDDAFECINFFYKNKEYYLWIENSEYEMPFLFTTSKEDHPHYLSFIEKVGVRYICLFDNIDLINSIIPQEDKIRIVIERLIKLENLSKNEISKEYLKEFSLYWDKVCECKDEKLQLYLANETEYEWLNSYVYSVSNKKTIRYVADGIVFNDKDKRKLNFSNKKALFLKITNTNGLLPPINNKKWSSTEIIDIFCNTQLSRIVKKAFDDICNISYSRDNLMLILEINNFYVACEIQFKNSGTAKLVNKIENQIVNITHRNIKRCDFNYLSNQIGNDVFLKDKRILLIGCGSLGSYISEELIKSGCTNLTVYDGDIYEPENICRNKYPLVDEGYNKALLTEFSLKYYHPEIDIISNRENFGVDKSLDGYDLIISTVGSSDTQLKFNEYFHEKFSNKPVVYAWLEGDGNSSHALCTYNNGRGCYNCCFISENKEYTDNRFNISEPSQTKYISNCCGGARIAYGTSTLLSATLIVLKAVEDVFADAQNEPFIYNFINGCISKSFQVKSNGCDFCNEN